jgi:uncharacterized membrane-anchored protein YhcB (DUF1043 family)
VQPPLASIALASWADPTALVIGALALGGAFAIGIVIGRRRSHDAAERARELEDRLQLAEDEMNRYRQEVSEHFGQTSKLLRDLTIQYRNVYEHLADGARSLCPEAGTLLPGSLAEAALPAEASDPPRTNGAGEAHEAHDDAQLDLLEHAEAWHEPPGAEPEVEALEPLLDEELEPAGERVAVDERAAAVGERRA